MVNVILVELSVT